MDAGEINKKLEKLEGMDKEQKSAVLELIDIKVNSDMDKVLNSINALKLEIATMEAYNTAKFSGLQAEINGQVAGLSHKIDSVQKIVFGFL